MKSTLLAGCLCGALSGLSHAADPVYTNFIRQVQLPDVPSGTVAHINDVTGTGEQDSPLPINPNGARFELWTVRSQPLAQYLLESRYVGTFVPIAQVTIDTEDGYGKATAAHGVPDNVTFENPNFQERRKVPVNLPGMVRRTRADRPFRIYVKTSGLLSGEMAPVASRSVNLFRHVQSYGARGIGHELDRNQAILHTQSALTTNDTFMFHVTGNSIPGSNRAEVRGEERFSVFTVHDNAIPSQPIPPSQLTSETIKIWPVPSASISAIHQDQVVRFTMPKITFSYVDSYPGSATYAQVYKGEPQLGKIGTIVPGSHRMNTKDHVESYTETTGSDLDSIFEGDGRWTMEVLTETPFGVDRLGYVTFQLNRSIRVHSNLTTIDE